MPKNPKLAILGKWGNAHFGGSAKNGEFQEFRNSGILGIPQNGQNAKIAQNGHFWEKGQKWRFWGGGENRTLEAQHSKDFGRYSWG